MAMVAGRVGTIWTVTPGRLFGSTEGAACLFFGSTFFSLFFLLASAISSMVSGRISMVSKSIVGSTAHNGTDEGPYRW